MQDILRDGDTWSRQLYDLLGHVVSYADTDIARAALDINRSPDDRPPDNPDGVVKSVTADGVQVWEDPAGLSPELADLIVNEYHRPYHEGIKNAARAGTAVLGIDCHTMLIQAPPIGPDAGRSRPAICISNGGNEKGEEDGGPLTAPSDLVRALRDAMAIEFRDIGTATSFGDETVLINDPFRGGYICRRHANYGPIPWVQFEINRGLYLPDTPELTEKPDGPSLERLKDIRERFIRGLRRVI
jgi:formiminoglutamase